uniref:superoxide dismutase n=1 Tax=Acanthocheilonema viteae TaxID=6277 RepID=O77253_ACAVI|nr:extracellular copper/zinc superoxide dismutase [Acanthocheilonema viteae]
MMHSFIIFLLYIISAIYADSMYIARESNSKLKTRNYTTKMKAVAVLRSDTVNGTIFFQQDNKSSPVMINGKISGLTPGLHGFHNHQYGDMTNGCISAGAHFNPFGKTHSGPTDQVKHIGDLGNIKAGADGIAHINISSNYIKLSGPISIIGRSLVVHAMEDDLGKGIGDKREESLKTGNAGSRVTCSIIGIADSI